MPGCAGVTGLARDEPDARAVWLRVYKDLIEALDAVDNGIDPFESDAPPRYSDSTTLAARVGHLNPPWNVAHSAAELDLAFSRAVQLTGAEFDAAVRRATLQWLPARSVVSEALSGAADVHASGASRDALASLLRALPATSRSLARSLASRRRPRTRHLACTQELLGPPGLRPLRLDVAWACRPTVPGT